MSASRWVLPLLLFAWPFVFFARTWIPAQSWSLVLTNDFVPLYYRYKVYLLDALSSGHFPLWSPMEAAGYPFYSNPFAQALYPLNGVLAVLYEWLGGYSRFDHQFFAVAGVSLFAIGLFLWLRRLESNPRAVLLAVAVCSVSFKMGELLRFPNAVHSAAWIPWLLYGLTLMRHRASAWRGALVTFTAAVMLLTAGYPYYAYYLLFVLPLYIAVLTWRPDAVRQPGADAQALPRIRYLLACGAAGGMALALLAPYLLKMSLLTGATADRGGDDYFYSTSVAFTPLDSLGSLLHPPVASAEGWYFFSTTALVLVLVWLARALLVRVRGDTVSGVDAPTVFALAVFALVSVITWGGDWYLFDWLWHYLPGFSSLRIWGRLNILMVPVVALLLARAWAAFELHCRTQQTPAGRAGWYAGTACVVLAVQCAIYLSAEADPLWEAYFARAASPLLLITLSACALALLGLVAAVARRGAGARAPAWPVLLVLLACTAELYPVGAQQWTAPADDARAWSRTRLDLASLLSRSFQQPRVRQYDTLKPPDFNVGWVKNWYFQRYVGFDRSLFVQAWEQRGGTVVLGYGAALPMGEVLDERAVQAWRQMMGTVDGQRLFITAAAQHAGPLAFMQDATRMRELQKASASVLGYDGDTLTLDAFSPTPAFVHFIDNWDPDWRVCVNGAEVRLLRAFGTFKSVQIGAGTSRVRFVYSPWPFRRGSPCA